MALSAWFAQSHPQPGAPGLRALAVSREQWRQVAQDLAAAGARLLSLWASGDAQVIPRIHAAFLSEYGGLVLTMPMPDPDFPYTGFRNCFPRQHGCNARWQTYPDCALPMQTRVPGCATQPGRKAIGH